MDVQAVLRRRQHHRQGIHQARPRTAQNGRHPGFQRAGVVHFGDGGDFCRSVPIPNWFEFLVIYKVFESSEGGISTGIYPTNGPDACKYILEDSRTNILVSKK